MEKSLNIPKKPIVYAAGTICTFVAVLFKFKIENLILLSSVLFLTPYVSGVIGRRMTKGLRCERGPSEVGVAGQSMTLSLSIRNNSRVPKLAVQITDTLPSSFESISTDPLVVTQLWSQEAVTLIHVVRPRIRGVFQIGPAVAISHDPLGLAAYRVGLPSEHEVIVYPAPLALSIGLVHSLGAQGWSATDTGSVRGSGSDFFGVREYQHGDELRRVHWRSTARLGKLAVTESARGHTGDITFVLDQSLESYKDNKQWHTDAFECAITVCISLIARTIQDGYPFELFGQEVEVGPRGTNAAHGRLAEAQEALARASCTSRQTLPELFAAKRPAMRRGTTLVYITTARGAAASLTAFDQLSASGASLVGYILELPFITSNRGGARESDQVSTGVPGRSVRISGEDDLAKAIESPLYGTSRR